MLKQLTVFLLLFISTSLLHGAEKSKSYKIEWLPVFENRITEEETFRSFNFTGASFDENYMPVLYIKEPVSNSVTEIKARIFNVVTEPVKQEDLKLIRNKESIGTDFTVTPQIVTRKKKNFSSIAVFPFRKVATGFEKLISFDLDFQPVYTAARLSQGRTYTSTSVLATGDWYKIAVLQTGVFKIDYSFLKNMGMDVDNINPQNIKLFGNGGGMLPFLNSEARYDDLQENAIIFSGEGDGTLDAQDYILFYGTNQTKWKFDSATAQFNHKINLYSDTTYYFLNVGSDPGKRISQRASISGANNVVTTYDDYYYHQAELYNFLKSGREWFGEAMDYLNNTTTISASFPNLSTADPINFRSVLAGRVTLAVPNSFTFSLNNTVQGSTNFSFVGPTVLDPFLVQVNLNKSFTTTDPNLNFKFTLNSTDPNAKGWLNYFEINFRRELNASNRGNQFSFRDKNTVGLSNISEFRISNTNNALTVWDVTDPINIVNQETMNVGGSTNFTVATDKLREFIAFDGQQYNTPSFTGMVVNQNLHGLAQTDMLIVTNPLFLTQAYELADFHRTHDNLSVVVATTQQIFNEFSSGAQDVSAIRDFTKMFYDRATGTTDLPRFLLLFGDASYDNKYRIAGNTNLVTSYQSAGSTLQTQTYMSDDFFGLLDNSEGNWIGGEIVDLSVGRMPVKTAVEAQSAVNKVKHYVQGNGTTSANPTLANWRNVVTFIGDDQDHNTHMNQADTLAQRVFKKYPLYNLDKIFIDAYNQERTPGGQRYPDAHKAIVDRVERGTLLISYIGHGGEMGWALERILEINDINGWTNFDKLAAFLTATCEFTRADDPERTSAGELVFLNPNGGGICMFTTSRLAFASSNFNLCKQFFTHVFDNSSGQFPTCGEIFEQTKVDYYTDPYVRNFLMIGDPAVRLAYPKFNVKTKTVNGIDISQPIDTLKALSKITITGEIQDNSGNKLTNFNGIIFPTVFDKLATYYSLGNDQFDVDPSTPVPFFLQKNVIYSGKASVTNGDFSFTFVVPKDIAFQYGKGKLSYYAENGQLDAAGYDTIITTGGINLNAPIDVEGPEVKLYINDEKFVRGGLTDENPVLYAVIQDSSGLNTVGTGIGHDMTAEFSTQRDNKYILNDFYENDLDNYRSGKVRYQFLNLASGPHSLTFKVWDVYNNSTTTTTDFIVSESADLALEHVLNYPNPFSTHTTFMFEHNRPYIPLNIQVQIFTVSGKLIKTISDKITMPGYRSDDIEWDGLDDYGDKIGRGVYVYRLRVKTDDGQYADKFEKLVILR